MNENADEEEIDEVFPTIEIATRDFADKVKEEIISNYSSNRQIEIWIEAGFRTWHKQLGFTVWYNTREDREAAILDGEAKSIEDSIRECCIKRGFPHEEQDRIYVWIDCHQAFAKLINKEESFNKWMDTKELPEDAKTKKD
jgi:hypothetical protein